MEKGNVELEDNTDYACDDNLNSEGNQVVGFGRNIGSVSVLGLEVGLQRKIIYLINCGENFGTACILLAYWCSRFTHDLMKWKN